MSNAAGEGQTPSVVALLPLKAHSARVPGKNFKALAGRPLFQWILDTLLALPEVRVVVINTDARKELLAAGLVESERVVIRDRKPELCGDMVSMNKVLADDVANVPTDDCYLMTHTTNPFLSVATIQAALDQYRTAVRAQQNDSLFSVNKFQTRFYRQNGEPINHDPDNLIRTQDLEPYFEENSCLYLFTAASFASTGARIGRTPLLFPTPKRESADIDNQEDWDLAEMIAAASIASK